tara:strand:+ start:80 stop:523 length:444 start_codon:yes stop_codon:yes gene_type:complete
MSSRLVVNQIQDSASKQIDTTNITNGTPKFWVNYNAPNATTDGSFNQSSLADSKTGSFISSFTNNFLSTTDKCVLANLWNTTDGGTTVGGDDTRGLSDICQGDYAGSMNAASTTGVQFSTAYGAKSTGNGNERDYSGTYVAQIGDLA